MSDTVDKRVVQMAFENSNFEQNVGKSLGTINKLKASLNFADSEKSMNGLTAAANNVNLSNISNSLETVKNKFSLMGIVGFTVIQNLTNSAITLGKKLVEAFIGVDSIKQGFGSYETKINAIRTVMSGTGETIDQVTQSINDLNKYSDRTIFSFQDMTENISKFTNAGLSSKDAATAIQGISNVAAESGASANEAARAMYNFGQALQQGSVRLMDWKSIENANMATIEFKTQLLEAAAAAGTLEKQADGTFKTLEGGEILSATKNFNNSLEKQWLTAEVLTKTLADYASTETEIGKKANEAATKVRTFSQMMATFADSMKTGWTKSFEIVVGDLNEATSLFSTISDFLGNTVVAAGKARNELLQGWKDLGGRTVLVNAFQNALNGVVAVLNPIIKAFKEIFPPVTAQQLVNFSKAILTLTERFKMAAEGTDKFGRIFKGVFAFFDIVRMAITALLRSFLNLVGSFSSTGASLTELIAKFGDWMVELRNSIKDSDIFVKVFDNIAKVIGSVIHGITGFFSALIGGFKSSEKATKSESLANFLEALGEKFKAFGKIGEIISKVFGIISRLVEKLGPIVGKVASKIGDLMSTLLDKITNALDKLDINKVLSVFNTGLLGGILLSIKGFISNSKGLIGDGMFGAILVSLKTFIDNGGGMLKGVTGILDSVKGSLDAYQKTLKANTLLKIAGAIAILVASIVALTLVDQGKLVNATAAIGAMFIALASTLDVFEKTTSGGQKILVLTGSFLGLAGALLIMSGVIVILSKLDPKAAAQGVASIGAILGMLLLFQKFSASATGFVGATAGLVGLSVAMLAMGVAIRSLGGTETETLVKGLTAMATVLGIVAVAMNAMSGTIGGSASVLVAAGALLVLSGALKVLGSMSLEQIGLSLLAIAGTLTILGIAGSVLTPVAPVIAVIAASLLAMGLAATAFGVGVAAIGAGLGSLAVGIVTLSGLTAAGIAAVTLVITGLAALIPMLATQVVKGIVAFLTEITASIPKIAIAMAKIGVAIIQGFVTLTPQLVEAVLGLIKGLVEKLQENLPEIVKTGGQLLIGFLQGIRQNIFQVVTVSVDIVNQYLKAVASKLPEVIQSGWDLIISWIDGLAAAAENNIPRLMESVAKLGWAIVEGIVNGIFAGNDKAKEAISRLGQTIIDHFKEKLGIHSPSTIFFQFAGMIIEGLKNGFINGLAALRVAAISLGTTIVESLRGKYDSMLQAGKDLVRGFAQGITGYISQAIDAAKSLATAVLNKIKETLGINSPAKELIDVGMYADQGMATGITRFAGVVTKAVAKVGESTISSFGSVISKITDSVNSNMNFSPTIRPVVDLSNIQSSSSQIDDILGNKSINVGVAATTAASIASRTAQPVDTQIVPAATTTQPSVSFTQINNSPKELSRIEIYRQTRNQLLQSKGLVGAL